MSTPRAALALAGTVLALALSACAPDASGASAGVTVEGFRFQPQELEVPAGTTVTWTNRDGVTHTATSGQPGAADDGFDVGLPEAGTTGAHTFEEPGTYAYFCAVHESMTAAVTVTG